MSLITAPEHYLDWNDLRVSSPDQEQTTAPFVLKTLGQDWDLGNAVPLDEVLTSLMRDGDLTRTTRWGNREASFLVDVIVTDGDAFADGEAALAAGIGRPGTLTWRGPAAGASPAVFDIQTAVLNFVSEAEREMRLVRRYQVRLTCLPWARAQSKVRVAALTQAITPLDVELFNGSESGWSTYSADLGPQTPVQTDGVTRAGLTTPGGQLQEGTTFYNQTQGRFLDSPTLGSPVDMTGTQYLNADVEIDTRESVRLVAFADGAEMTLLATTPAPRAGFTRYCFSCADPALHVVRFGIVKSAFEGKGIRSGTVSVDQVRRTNVPPAATSNGRQQIRSAEIVGSVRSEGSLSVAATTGGLGQVLVYTAPGLAGFVPSLSRYASTDGTATDSANLSGTSRDHVFSALVPAGSMPRGGYTLWASLKRRPLSETGPRTVTVTAQSSFGSGLYGTVETCERVFDDLDDFAYQLLPIGSLTLPPTDSPIGAAGSVQITVASADVRFDEILAFYTGDGAALTYVNAAASSRLWIDAPSPTDRKPRLWIGTQDDRGDAHHPGPGSSWGQHILEPGALDIFTVTSGTANADVDADYFPHFHTHPDR